MFFFSITTRVVDSFDVAGSAWTDPVVSFDMKKFFDCDHITTCKDVVSMKIESGAFEPHLGLGLLWPVLRTHSPADRETFATVSALLDQE
jgi:hypothetical protein